MHDFFLNERDLLGASKTCPLTAGPTTYHSSPSHRRARANPRPTIPFVSLAPPNCSSSPATKPAIAGGRRETSDVHVQFSLSILMAAVWCSADDQMPRVPTHRATEAEIGEEWKLWAGIGEMREQTRSGEG
jgi:hypothetical protein